MFLACIALYHTSKDSDALPCHQACKPLRLSIDPNGNIWFTEEGTNKVGGLPPTGQMVPEFPAGTFNVIIAASTGVVAVLNNRPRKKAIHESKDSS